MTRCPKCRSSEIKGPVYIRSMCGGEYLKYTCAKCGYSRHDTCADHEPHPMSLDPVKTWPHKSN